MMKTHFAIVEPANESDNNSYWSDTICGTESEELTNKWNLVNCKRCLRLKSKAENEH